MILRYFISLRAFTVYMVNSLRYEISFRSNWPKWNLHWSEFHYARSHVNADNEVLHTEVKFYPEVKSQIGLSSLRVSCKRALSQTSQICSSGLNWPINEKVKNRKTDRKQKKKQIFLALGDLVRSISKVFIERKSLFLAR